MCLFLKGKLTVKKLYLLFFSQNAVNCDTLGMTNDIKPPDKNHQTLLWPFLIWECKKKSKNCEVLSSLTRVGREEAAD